ncbi:outer membrane protein [Elusimicrobium posterum]|uniref:TolC family protein n=1 Tax=Elusimicrobium posterum TaxID=3116653 RepID=UPI003C721E11
MKKYLTLLFLICAAGVATAQVSEISLAQCEADALQYSPKLKELQAQVSAARAQYKGAKSSYYPSLYIDAQGGWVSEVPKLNLGPLSYEFGDNWSYMAGPTLEYLLFDYGGRSGASEGAKAMLQAAQNEYDFGQKSVKLDVRQAYFTVQQDLEKMYFLSEQLKVAQKQLEDVNSALKAGAKSRLDMTMAQKQELRSQVNIANARGALGIHLRQLFMLTGKDYGINPLYPADWRIEISKQDKAPSAKIKADSLEDTLKALQNNADFAFDENSSKLAAAENMALYYEKVAQSLKSSLYPVVKLSGGAYWEYPNGPIKEHVFLGKAGASLRMPLFEGSKTKSQSAAQQSQADAARHQKTELEDNLKNMFYSSKSLLYSLDLQTQFVKQMIETSAETARLTYDAYKAGSVTFLEVDNANLALLESRIALADVYVESLNRLAVMENLGASNNAGEN